MRVLMTTDTVGGVWTFTSELSGDLLKRGHAVALLSFGRLPSDEQSDWATMQRAVYPERFQYTASTAPLEWAQENTRTIPEGGPALAAVAGQFGPDLLVSSQFWFGAANLGIPRVVVAHSDVLSWARACKLAALTSTPWLQMYKQLVGDGLRQAEAVVAPTAAVLQDLSLDFSLSRPGVVISNGRSLPAIESVPKRKLQAISAGRLWDEAKGLDLLASCELALPVVVAGETHFGGESEPTRPESVTFLGPLSPEELQRHFRESSLYLCTSRYEPFGLAPLEAALCGCAIVARDLPSLREVWGDDALYFRDAAGLQAQVRRLTENEVARSSFGERAQRRAATYSTERMTDGYLALFGRLLQQAEASYPV